MKSSTFSISPLPSEPSIITTTTASYWNKIIIKRKTNNKNKPMRVRKLD